MSALVRRISVCRTASFCAALLALSLGLAAPASRAEDEPAAQPMHRVEFQVERSRDVANDLVTALLRVTHDDADPARLAGRVNGDVRWALELVRKETGVEVESGAYYTNPIRERERITGWTASQEILLTTRDTAALTRLVGQLQERLQLSWLHFSVSVERRRSVEDELIREALEAYAKRAELIRSQLGAASHELVYLSVNASGTGPPVPAPYAEGRFSAKVAEPSVEAGTSSVSVAVSATIELR